MMSQQYKRGKKETDGEWQYEEAQQLCPDY